MSWHTLREHAASFLAGGSGSSDGAQRLRVAAEVFPPGHAARPQGRHGAPPGASAVLDVAQSMGLRAVNKVQSARDSPEQALVCSRTPSSRLGSPLPLAGSSN